MRSITVQDCMTRSVITLSPDMEVVEALRVLLKNKITAAPVLDGSGQLVGILYEVDCLAGTLSGSYYSQGSNLVSEFMTTGVLTAKPLDSIVDVYQRCMVEKASRVPVVSQNGDIVGMISPKDLMAAVLEYYEKPIAEK